MYRRNDLDFCLGVALDARNENSACQARRQDHQMAISLAKARVGRLQHNCRLFLDLMPAPEVSREHFQIERPRKGLEAQLPPALLHNPIELSEGRRLA